MLREMLSFLVVCPMLFTPLEVPLIFRKCRPGWSLDAKTLCEAIAGTRRKSVSNAAVAPALQETPSVTVVTVFPFTRLPPAATN